MHPDLKVLNIAVLSKQGTEQMKIEQHPFGGSFNILWNSCVLPTSMSSEKLQGQYGLHFGSLWKKPCWRTVSKQSKHYKSRSRDKEQAFLLVRSAILIQLKRSLVSQETSLSILCLHTQYVSRFSTVSLLQSAKQHSFQI